MPGPGSVPLADGRMKIHTHRPHESIQSSCIYAHLLSGIDFDSTPFFENLSHAEADAGTSESIRADGASLLLSAGKGAGTVIFSDIIQKASAYSGNTSSGMPIKEEAVPAVTTFHFNFYSRLRRIVHSATPPLSGTDRARG